MRKIVLLLASVLVLFSCSNEHDEFIGNNSSEQFAIENDSEVLPYEEFLALADESYLNDPEFSEENASLPSTRASVLEMEAIGYTSSKVRDGMGNKKVYFTTSFNGLSAYTVYIVDYYEVEQRVFIPATASGAFEMTSPDCGYHPGISGSRGYTSYRDGNYFVMKTNVTHVKADILGRTWNVWLPFTRGSLKWKYGLIFN